MSRTRNHSCSCFFCQPDRRIFDIRERLKDGEVKEFEHDQSIYFNDNFEFWYDETRSYEQWSENELIQTLIDSGKIVLIETSDGQIKYEQAA